MNGDRAQVGKQAQRFANGEQSLLGAHLCIRVRPLRTADRAEQDGICVSACREARVGQCRLRRVDRGAADQVRFELELVTEAFSDRCKDAALLRA